MWIDETGCDKRDNIRKFGYSMRGERRFITVSSIKVYFLLNVHLGTVDGDKFTKFNSECYSLKVPFLDLLPS